MVSEQGESNKMASTEKPEYRKQHQDGTMSFWIIVVDEGWRTWILCTDMYEWAADGLLKILRESNATWPR